MKLTIIRADGSVYKDGVSYSDLDLSFIPSNVHALQFNDVSIAGWIEFVENDFGEKEPNEKIIMLPNWATLSLSKWDEANAIEESLILAAKEAEIRAAQIAEANQPQTTGTQTA